MSAQVAVLSALHVYPIKSCRGIELDAAQLTPTGLADDRHWMLVRPSGRFVTQRELPRMALISTALSARALTLAAPGAAPLIVSREQSGESAPVTVWGFTGRGIDCGEEAALWCTSFLGTPLRLMRFDASAPRTCSVDWTGDVPATTEFSDGFPILVISRASLAELNSRLPKALPMERFRPNLVLDGLDPHGEDALDEIVFDTDAGPVRLKLVKPCARCPIPDVDPETGIAGHAVGDTLASYRADARLDGALTFGMNAVIVEGIERALRVGMTGRARYRFD